MGSHDIADHSFRNTRPSDDEWYMDVFLEPTDFPRLKSMLANMEAIVARIEDVGIVEEIVLREATEKLVDHFVHRLKCPQAVSIKQVIVIDVGLVLFRQMRDPCNTTGLVHVNDSRKSTSRPYLVWVEIWRPGNDDIFKEVLMSFRRNRR